MFIGAEEDHNVICPGILSVATGQFEPKNMLQWGQGGRRNADTYWVFNKKRIKVYVFVELSQTIISK